MSDVYKITHRNMLVYFATATFYTASASFLAEGYIQSYLLELGMNTHQIGIFGTLSTLAALVAYALFSRYKPGNASRYVHLMLGTALVASVYPMMLVATNLFSLPYFVLYAGVAIYQLCMAVKTSCEYSAVPLLFPRREYGTASARCGMIGSGVAAVLSLASAALSGVEKLTMYTGFFSVAAVGLLASALVIRVYRPVESLVSEEETRAGASKMRPGRAAWLLLPHLLRGVSAAFFYYFVSVGLRNVTLSATGQSIFVSLGVLGTMTACFLFMKLQARFRTGAIILVSNVVCALSAVGVCMCRSEWGFFAMYTIYMLSLNVTAYAIPVGVIYATPLGELPFISSMRMFMFNGAMCVLLTPIASLMSILPAWQVMTMGGAAFVLCGFIFFLQFKDALKD